MANYITVRVDVGTPTVFERPFTADMSDQQIIDVLRRFPDYQGSLSNPIVRRENGMVIVAQQQGTKGLIAA